MIYYCCFVCCFFFDGSINSLITQSVCVYFDLLPHIKTNVDRNICWEPVLHNSVIFKNYWQHLTPKSTCLQSPYLLLVFFILKEVTISVICEPPFFFLQVRTNVDRNICWEPVLHNSVIFKNTMFIYKSERLKCFFLK
jgi:hypothetical protein